MPLRLPISCHNREYILDNLPSSAVLPEQSLLLCKVAQNPKVERRNGFDGAFRRIQLATVDLFYFSCINGGS